MSYEKWTEELKANFDETVAWRRHLHEYPEPSFEEEQTAAFIVTQLQQMGIEDIQTNVGNGYGIVAKIYGDHAGPTIAFRADFDALRIHEETDVPFQSKNPGIMHACGHDGHTASLLSVAKVLSKHKADLHGNVVLLHQNAEEVVPGGAKSMIEAGCLMGVDYVFGIHVMSVLEAGKIAYSSSYGSAGSDSFQMQIQGKGGHGAAPHTTVDSVMIGTQIVTTLQTLVSRQVDPVQPAVVTFSGFQAGGEANNIIADKAVLRGTIRTLSPEVRDLMEVQVNQMSQSIAAANQGTVKIRYTRGYPSIMNTPLETERLTKVMQEKFGDTEVLEVEAGMGGEDFAYYLQEKPGTFFYVGAKNAAIEANYPHHHPKFKIDETALLRSGEAFLAIAEDYLVNKAD